MTTFKPNHTLTQAKVKELLAYDKRTGILRWRKGTNKVPAGSIAGSRSKEGYIRITVDRHRVMAHIVIWLYVTGEYVVRGVDHIDTDGFNNRWKNLRRATRSQNNMNQSLRSDNALGVKGVRMRVGKKTRPYYATIKPVGGKQIHLGNFDTLEEAAEAYRVAAERLFGEFARVK